MNYINLACGPVYISEREWTNVDFCKGSPNVTQCDLLEPLPFASNVFDVVYSSHFIEHVPRSKIRGFLLECRRVLKPGGYIRLVLPDCVEMFSTFLSLRAQGMHKQADFVILEIIDQCVRTQSGGELGAFYKGMQLMEGVERIYWQSFVAHRNGQGLEIDSINMPSVKVFDRNLLASLPFQEYLARVYSRIRRQIHKLGLWLLTPAFLRQNVSLAAIGECHCWLWDFQQLKVVLEDAGFSCVTRQSHLKSSISDFPFVPLDSSCDGRPRKGVESMFVEAQLPRLNA